MGLFTNSQKNTAVTIYSSAKQYLKKKDGKVHVVMFNSFGKFSNLSFECENKYTIQIDEVLTGMQNDGYEIIDVKFAALPNQGLSDSVEGYNTLIIYK
jgi:hypothetical protein